jgi:serine kinase of HPr protein (carbohydrate metabolism regulator)
MSKEYDVLVVVEVKNLEDKKAFDKYLKKEGLLEIEGEEYAYKGVSSTPLFNTRAFLEDTFKKALKKAGNFDEFKMVVQLGENPLEVYRYNKEKKSF